MPGIPNYPELFLTLDLYSGIMDGIGKILGKPEFNLSSTSAWQMKLQHENVTHCTVLLQDTTLKQKSPISTLSLPIPSSAWKGNSWLALKILFSECHFVLCRSHSALIFLIYLQNLLYFMYFFNLFFHFLHFPVTLTLYIFSLLPVVSWWALLNFANFCWSNRVSVQKNSEFKNYRPWGKFIFRQLVLKNTEFCQFSIFKKKIHLCKKKSYICNSSHE